MPCGRWCTSLRDQKKKEKEKVLHLACLLLWFTDNDLNADGIRLNYLIATTSRFSITNAENTDLMSEAHSNSEMGAVLHELDYGMNLANFILDKHSLDLLLRGPV